MRQTSLPFQLGTHASPAICVTTNGAVPVLRKPVTVLVAGSTIAIRLRRICGTQTLPATTSGSPSGPASGTVAATAFVVGSSRTTPLFVVTQTASSEAAVQPAFETA